MHDDNRPHLGNLNLAAQGAAKRVLFVCTGGMLRSATAAHWATAALGWNTRSCGTNADALPPVHANLMEWAEVVYCMELRHTDILSHNFSWARDKIETLGIPDQFEYNAGQLIALLEEVFTRKGENCFTAIRNLADDNIRLRLALQGAWPYVNQHCTDDSLRTEIVQEICARAIVQTGLSLPTWGMCAAKRDNNDPLSALENFVFHNEPAGSIDGEFRAGLLCLVREIMRVNPTPSAWMRRFRTHDTTDSPAEWVEEVVPGEDRPEGDLWTPLFAQRQV